MIDVLGHLSTVEWLGSSSSCAHALAAEALLASSSFGRSSGGPRRLCLRDPGWECEAEAGPEPATRCCVAAASPFCSLGLSPINGLGQWPSCRPPAAETLEAAFGELSSWSATGELGPAFSGTSLVTQSTTCCARAFSSSSSSSTTCSSGNSAALSSSPSSPSAAVSEIEGPIGFAEAAGLDNFSGLVRLAPLPLDARGRPPMRS
mmetsp:Transcript_71487/g.126271  ORF Transcript_71487/g.126271 Transcript_71487/m.126271 type:complete len:205 (-) Transcript_71487:639-1253(-)